MSPFFIWVFKH